MTARDLVPAIYLLFIFTPLDFSHETDAVPGKGAFVKCKQGKEKVRWTKQT